ncbi:hypothetical protein ACOACO_03245 [Nocardioides sp. CPCC 205120]|uniref:hypothetical protein n=1 Tax=Nocardioides sp. CPCC 205120 TaxID=3406462 RepID=UPI003B51534E
MDVVDPRGRQVRVRRRLLPWRPRRRVGYEPAQPDWIGDDLAGLVLGVVVGLVVLPLLLLTGVLVLEVALFLLVLPLYWLTRVVLRRPWTVDVLVERRAVHSEAVRGWRASGDLVASLAERVRHGDLVLPGASPPTDGTGPVPPGEGHRPGDGSRKAVRPGRTPRWRPSSEGGRSAGSGRRTALPARRRA